MMLAASTESVMKPVVTAWKAVLEIHGSPRVQQEPVVRVSFRQERHCVPLVL